MKALFPVFIIAALIGWTSFDTLGDCSKLSPHTIGFLHMYETYGNAAMEGFASMRNSQYDNSRLKPQIAPMTKLENINGVPMVEGIIKLTDYGTEAEVEAAGAMVSSAIGNMLIAKMPVTEIESIAKLESVAYIDIARPVKPFNDVARDVTNVSVVQSGEALDRAYTGKGVIVGIIDTGIDFNNINFKDANGDLRVKRAYDSYSTYSSPDEIEKLTTDNTAETHGTHVAGTAAGSYTANNYQGMAPDADLYLSGLGEVMYTTSIIEQADNMVSYAREQGQPIVVNLSLGSNIGPHTGTDPVSEALDQLSGDGVIFVFATGNEGDINLYLNKQFENPTGTEQFQTICYSPYYSGCYGNFAGYCENPTSVQFMVVDVDNGNEIVYETDVIEFGEEGGSWDLSQSRDADYFYNYFDRNDSYLNVYGYYEQGLFATYVEVQLNARSVLRNNYRLGIRFYGTEGDEFNMWSDANIEFIDNDDSEFMAGTTDCSISELVTGREAISVGSYTTKNKWSSIVGNYTIHSEENTMSDFSSYGVDKNGVWHPTIVAPGCVVASSLNRYSTMESEYIVDQQQIDGSTYSWGVSQGTSMACPVVTGIIATWLQYDPTLSPSDIKQIFSATAQKPENYGEGIELQWGPNGLIDAYAGLRYMLTSGVNDISKTQNVVLVYPNPSNGQFKIVAQGEDEVTLSIYTTSGGQVYNRKYDTTDGCIDVDLQGALSKGIYMLKVCGRQCNYNGKIIID